MEMATGWSPASIVSNESSSTSSGVPVQPVEKKSRTADMETFSMSAVAADIIKSINEEIIVPAGSTKDTIAAV